MRSQRLIPLRSLFSAAGSRLLGSGGGVVAEPLIRFEEVHFKYNAGTEREWAALQDITLEIYPESLWLF